MTMLLFFICSQIFSRAICLKHTTASMTVGTIFSSTQSWSSCRRCHHKVDCPDQYSLYSWLQWLYSMAWGRHRLGWVLFTGENLSITGYELLLCWGSVDCKRLLLWPDHPSVSFSYKMQHRHNQSWFAILHVHFLYISSNLPEVNQRIINTSASLEHVYQNSPYSIDATSNPHNQKQLCNLRTFTSTQQNGINN